MWVARCILGHMRPRPARSLHQYTYEAYLEFEAGNNARHEYLEGEIYAMAGGTLEHAAMAASVIVALGAELRGRPCTVYSSDLKVRVLATGLATYPDVTVICGRAESDPKSDHVALNPTLIVEVTSSGTETWDRGEKLDHYKAIPSLQEVVLVSHRRRRIELHRRDAGSSWNRHESGPGESLSLKSIDCTLRVDDVYRNVDVPA